MFRAVCTVYTVHTACFLASQDTSQYIGLKIIRSNTSTRSSAPEDGHSDARNMLS